MASQNSDDKFDSSQHPHNVGFEAAEHTLIGNLLSLTFPSGTIPGTKFNFKIKEDKVALGDIVALAGDFYGNWAVFGDAEQISDKWESDRPASVERFKENAKLLATDSPGYMRKVLDIMIEERELIKKSVADGRDPAQEYAKIADDFNKRYGWATRWGVTSAYLNISLCNWDHFGQDAIYAYSAGHTAALAQAKIAHGSGNEVDLRYAYFLEGFALHFFTDLFSSGHLRPPRRILHRTLTGDGDDDDGGLNPWPADACAKEFHDEDCANGLWVTNSLGDSWAMYGDGQLFSAKSTGNLSRVVRASQIGIDEVWKVFQTGDDKDPELFKPLEWVADLDKLAYPINFAPLFTYEKSTTVLSIRAKLEERANNAMKEVPQTFLSFRSTLAEIEASGTHKNRLPLTRNFPSSSPTIQLQKITDDLYMANKFGPVTSLDYSLVPPADTTTWNMISRHTPGYTPDSVNWTHPTLLTPQEVLAVTEKEKNTIPQSSGYAGYSVDFSNDATRNPIERQWVIGDSTSPNAPDAAIAGALSAGTEKVAFTPSPPGTLSKVFVFDSGIDQKPDARSTITTSGSGLMIRQALSISAGEGLPSQVLALASVVDDNVHWQLYGWINDYGEQKLYKSKEGSGPIISEQWWRYVTGNLLTGSNTTQIVRLLYGENAEKNVLRVDILTITGNPPAVTQAWTRKYDITLWGSPTEKQYLKWLLIDVGQSGNLDLVALINTDESTLTTVVFPSTGSFGFGDPVVSRIAIPDSLFNPAFFKSVAVQPAEAELPGGAKVNTGILQLLDNYQLLGARLIAPDAAGSLTYVLQGQTPAVAGQTTVGAGFGSRVWDLDDWAGYLVRPGQ